MNVLKINKDWILFMFGFLGKLLEIIVINFGKFMILSQLFIWKIMRNMFQKNI